MDKQVTITSQDKAAATRVEKKIREKIAAIVGYTGERPKQIHIYPKDYDALKLTGRLRGFGVELLRATAAH